MLDLSCVLIRWQLEHTTWHFAASASRVSVLDEQTKAETSPRLSPSMWSKSMTSGGKIPHSLHTGDSSTAQ